MKYALLFIILIYTKNCNSGKLSSENLDGTWRVNSIVYNKINNTNLTKCIIDLSKNSLVISVGCNNHMARIRVIKNELLIDNVIATEKYCQDLAALEKQLKNHLSNITNYKFKNDILSFYDQKGKIAITLIK